MSIDVRDNSREGAPYNNWRFDDAAFKVFFKQHYPLLCVYCKLKYGFDMHSAEDIVNSGFIKLWEVLNTLDADTSPKAYLYKIVDNFSLNATKR
jgi:RNA polymerase sigma-70 factor, ECF subfamily